MMAMASIYTTSVTGLAVTPPASVQIADSLRQRICLGELAVGAQLPPERALAQQLGVCTATVQKALKVLESEGLIEAHRGRGRFVSDWREARTGVVAVVLYDAMHLRHPLMIQRLAGVHDPLEAAGYHIHFIAMNRRNGAAEQGWVELIDPRRFDGAIVMALQAQPQEVARLAEHLPLVWMDHHSVRPGLLGVRSDVVGGAMTAAEHLMELGHRRIAVLNAGPETTTAREQHEGAQFAARRVTNASVQWLSVPRCVDDQLIRESVRKAFTGPERCTGLICGADDLVPSAIEELEGMGLRVPEDVSLVGWNDTLAPPSVSVELTSVKIDVNAVGRTAADTLRRMLDGEQPDPAWLEGQVTPAELVVRQSTAPPSC